MTATSSAAAALALLALTLALVLWRPQGLHEAWAAAIGAALALAFRLATPADLWVGLHDTASVLTFLVAVMLLAGLAEYAGVFAWAAQWTLRTARGRGWLLLVNVYALGAVITLLLSLDVTAVVLTPLVCALVVGLRLDARPFVLACAFVANTASLALPVSNLTNIMVYELLGVPFWSFVRYLALPNLVALAINLTLLLAIFWHRLPSRLVADRPAGLPQAPFFRCSLAVLAGTVLLLFVAGMFGWSFWPVAGPAALTLAVVSLRRRWITPRQVLGTVAWGLPPFVVGMFVVVAAVHRALAPVVDRLPQVVGHLPGPLPVLATAGALGVGANAVNNLPLSLAAIQVLRGVPPGALTAAGADLRTTLSVGTLLGVNLGPNLTVIGSLATMLCLASARRQGVHVSPGAYFRIGVLVTPPMLLASGLTAWLLLR